ncbi:hypothetical protein ACFT1A_30835 [Rhodococcus sp. NPDC057135]|uniref:hypothetical protein n=1 Tax=Rhodococcus sp. NPDC057135 TaxID=3346028 RepID=UPI00362C710C
MTVLDVTAAAYTAAVGHLFSAHRSPDGCARCAGSTETMTIPVGHVVSRRFTGYETWTNFPSRVLCEVCVWVYRHLPLRSCAHIIIADRLTPLMRYDIETLSPGTRFGSWVQLDRGSALDEASSIFPL